MIHALVFTYVGYDQLKKTELIIHVSHLEKD